MIFFLLAVLFTVALYLILRVYPRYEINNFHAIVFNYYACVLTGLVLTPDLRVFENIDLTSVASLYTLLLGSLFIVAFLMIGLTTQKVGVTASSLAGNLSLVIPVFFGLFVFRNTNKDFTFLNYAGLILAVVALGLSSVRPAENSSGTGKTSGMQWIWIFPVLTFLASGSNNTLINYLSMTYYEPGTNTVFMIIACSGAIIIGTLMMLWKIVAMKETFAFKNVVAGFALGVPNFLSLYFLLKALDAYGNSAAFVFPVYNILTMLVSAGIAWILFNEKLTLINKAGVLLAVIAIILLSYQELGL